MKTYYKVVLRKNKKLYSSFAHMFHFKPVRYMIGSWVKSRDKKHPRLFVTTSLCMAKSILRTDIEACQRKTGAIYECKVSGIIGKLILLKTEEYYVKKVKLIKRIQSS